MITLWLNALDHHHRLVIALSSPPIVCIAQPNLGDFGVRWKANNKWWMMDSNQWPMTWTSNHHIFMQYDEIKPHKACYISLFFFNLMPLAYLSTLCFLPFFSSFDRPLALLYFFLFFGLRPFSLFFSSLVALGHHLFLTM